MQTTRSGGKRLNLRVYIPPAVPPAELAEAKREIASLRNEGVVQLIDDPTQQTPSCVLQHGLRGWSLLRANGKVEELGLLSGVVLRARLSPGDALFINVPPPADLRQKIELGKGTRRELIAVMDSPVDVQYGLVGRVIGGDVEYAWVRPRMMTDDCLPAQLVDRSDFHQKRCKIPVNENEGTALGPTYGSLRSADSQLLKRR